MTNIDDDFNAYYFIKRRVIMKYYEARTNLKIYTWKG